jgi:histidinol dehydrogenase
MLKKISAGVSELEIEALLRRKKIDEQILSVVSNIIKEVRQSGDEALFEQIKKFDGAELNDLRVNEAEFEIAEKKVGKEFTDVLRVAVKRLTDFSKAELPKSWMINEEGIFIGENVRPLDTVGCYVPGGLAAYPSSVLMTVIPAKVAGVNRIIVCTPCSGSGEVNPYTLIACLELGCKEIYKIGGAGAVAAMAYGTESVPRVDKIVGPGNIYVAAAKKLVFGDVGIDNVAGPSEVVIIAQNGANARFVALDMLAQAEHGSGASAVLITDSKQLGEKVAGKVKDLSANYNKNILENFTYLLVDDLDSAVAVSDKIAPEHLELFVEDPLAVAEKVKNAGAVLLGEFTPASFGDYIAGPNHVLPTGGAARFQSPLSTRDFIKYTSVLYSNREALKKLSASIEILARAEGLNAHADAAVKRLEEDGS